MSNLTGTVGEWKPVEASLLEWRRLCKRMRPLDSTRSVDLDLERTHLGEVLWGIEVGRDGEGQMLGVCWEWREVITNVVALSNPLGVHSNVQLTNERGELVGADKLVLHLNAAINSFPWQGYLTGRVRDFHTRAA